MTAKGVGGSARPRSSQLENFADAIADRGTALIGRADAVAQARAIAALYRSAETGAAVAV